MPLLMEKLISDSDLTLAELVRELGRLLPTEEEYQREITAGLFDVESEDFE